MSFYFKPDLRLPELIHRPQQTIDTCAQAYSFHTFKEAIQSLGFVCPCACVCCLWVCLFLYLLIEIGSYCGAQANPEFVRACLSLPSNRFNHTQHLHKYFPRLSLP